MGLGLGDIAGNLMSGGMDFVNSAVGLYDYVTGTSSKRQYEYQNKLQENQQKWLENMSNTAHQREMADLKAAGINPLLTVTGGSGASTPSAGMGSVGLQSPGDMRPGSNSAARLALERRIQDAQIENLESSTDKNEADAAQARARTENDNAMTAAQVANINSSTALNKQTETMNQPSESESKVEKWLSDTWAGKAAVGAGYFARKIFGSGAGSAAVNSAASLRASGKSSTHNHYGNQTYVDYRGK